eukprot:CAMPEP_0113306750 /NCGR_PEP_ID=MMETSP0010_2-20120614/5875_1 /TAXON_ID=216773 ORGANISM="Corethron hystrix, Strain 308" /NCGR_SAMPLE_ID=MMETSP0010_2 /ASSEMBLY_ACC=CAM_ASM_000155 /LENGTH=100 /DNA_ID=CAMNT_0000161477 /DNA_START=652 /DNA_END=954 /DNA_ORIENTATION=+ /assembly_acc=CAM_ASM_000155
MAPSLQDPRGPNLGAPVGPWSVPLTERATGIRGSPGAWSLDVPCLLVLPGSSGGPSPTPLSSGDRRLSITGLSPDETPSGLDLEASPPLDYKSHCNILCY